jgi:ribosomal protein S18 acetylase RimI-like enzyme
MGVSKQPLGVKILVEGNLEMEEKIIIRDADVTDAPLIASLLRKMMAEEMEESGGYQISADEIEWNRFHETIKNNLSDENFTYKIAEISGEKQTIIGISEARVKNRAFVYQPTLVLHIHSLYVERLSRRKGIGKSLLEATLEWGRAKKCEEVELDVLESNSAQKLYKKIGFHPFEYKMMRKL